MLSSEILSLFCGKGLDNPDVMAIYPYLYQIFRLEAFGLIGFFATLQTLFLVLVTGLSTTVNGELARLSIQPGTDQKNVT